MSTQGHLPGIHSPAPMAYVPHNPQEFDDDMRVIAIRHMGLGDGNPSTWVIKAITEAFQRGFALAQGLGNRVTPEQFREAATQWAERVEPEQKAIGGPRAIEQATRPDVARLGGPSDIIDV